MEILRYATESGRDLIRDWRDHLGDAKSAARIVMRIDRLAAGNFGDRNPVGDGVWELRIDFGPGYRVYYSIVRQQCVLLLCGGGKRTQSSDIAKAIKYFQDYKRRTAKP